MNLRPFKVVALTISAMVVQVLAPAQAAVNMLSVQHRVWGNAGVAPNFDSYDQSGPGAMSGNAYGLTDWGDYVEENVASSSASDWSVQAFRSGIGYDANAFARNTYVFHPFSRVLSISLSGMIGVWWFENQARMTLTDLNTDTLISIYESPYYTKIPPFDLYENDMVDYPFTWSATADVEPAHEYELVIFAGAQRGESGDGSASLSLTLAPEPASILLAGMGAALMICRRKRPQSV